MPDQIVAPYSPLAAAFPASTCFTRFSIKTDFQVTNPVVMGVTYNDLIDGEGRNQAFVIKDIWASCVLPSCMNADGTINPSDEVRLLDHSYTFIIRINNATKYFPVDFVTTADRVRTQLVLARWDDVVRSLEVDVRRDRIDPAYDAPGIDVTLSFGIDLYPFNKNA